MFSKGDVMKPNLQGVIRLEASGDVPVGSVLRA